LEGLGIVFRVKVFYVINPSHFLTTDITDTPFTEAFWPCCKIQNLSKLEFVSP
jgi:hypothetical protein